MKISFCAVTVQKNSKKVVNQSMTCTIKCSLSIAILSMYRSSKAVINDINNEIKNIPT